MKTYEITVVCTTKREIVVKANSKKGAKKLAIKEANALVGTYCESYVENVEILKEGGDWWTNKNCLTNFGTLLSLLK